ncbi:MAG: diacylglycerol kinase [Holosporales bacterium]|jgi:diacylglycerol kinase (ATP)|nr:diacylglycerol kinase [Holosporales bacterium]
MGRRQIRKGIFKHVRDIKNAFYYSLNGIRFLVKERAFKHELYLGCIIVVIELFKNTSPTMRLYLFSSYFFILVTEAFNSAIETTVNRIGVKKHALSQMAKDISSAAVFLAIFHFGIVWILSFVL